MVYIYIYIYIEREREIYISYQQLVESVPTLNKKNEWKPITIWIKLNTLKLNTLRKITTKITVKPTKY